MRKRQIVSDYLPEDSEESEAEIEQPRLKASTSKRLKNVTRVRYLTVPQNVPNVNKSRRSAVFRRYRVPIAAPNDNESNIRNINQGKILNLQ